MYSGTAVILNPTGLHARPASRFSSRAKYFRSDITVRKPDGEEANAKSIVMVMGLGLGQGERVEITAAGPDEREAVDTLLDLIRTGLGE